MRIYADIMARGGRILNAPFLGEETLPACPAIKMNRKNSEKDQWPTRNAGPILKAIYRQIEMSTQPWMNIALPAWDITDTGFTDT